MTSSPTLTQVQTLLVGARADLEHAMRLLESLQAPTPTPVVSPREEALRKSAYLHQQHLREHGSLTLADSIAIRRQLSGGSVRSTANQFGRGASSGANFYRAVPYKTRTDPGQVVKLTAVGDARAEAYRQAHQLP